MDVKLLSHLIWLVPLALLCLYIGSPRFLGTMGSARIRRALSAALPKSQFTVFHDLTLPSGGGTTHFDHVIVSRFGVFVIDSVHRSGWISGTQSQALWRQQTWAHVVRFDNPVHTNFLRVQLLERVLQLPLSRFHQMVVFSGHKGFKSGVPDKVLDVSLLVPRIRARSAHILSAEEADRALLRLQQSAVSPAFFKRSAPWKMLRMALVVIFLCGSYLVYKEPIHQFLTAVQEQADVSMAPDRFRPDGTPKSEPELYEEGLACAVSVDTGRCACYERNGARADIGHGRCVELAERGSILQR